MATLESMEWQGESLVDTFHVSYIMKSRSLNHSAAINYVGERTAGDMDTFDQCTDPDSERDYEAKRGTPGPAFCSHSADRGKLRYRRL